MGKPIDKLEFWKERIDNAPEEHYSVYVIHQPGWKKILIEHLKIIEKEIPEEARVLDAGCGYGRMSPYFNDYTGVDFSPDFIEKAKTKFPKKKFIRANLKDLPFSDKYFDWAFCISIKQMVMGNLGLDEWKIMEKELRRVAKKVLILEYESPSIYETIE